ncbi:unnamed protein product [Medioppia subpectinata]|uniref:BTB domain-containing protein n=1 Tax=Medioppia subpectinata TaxID=1979941 RepID=A0A7R9KWE5_9ACAR|nr:unnamed protein product [Medioppia subpectinata]CAG2110735.1 unnamed protein product [Medioppia subpectinata]
MTRFQYSTDKMSSLNLNVKNNNYSNSCVEMKWFMSPEKSDVTFIVEGKRVPAVKDLLIHKSPVFEEILDDSYDKEIEIDGITYEAFKNTIRFIYCEHNYQLSDESEPTLAMQVFLCARNYKLQYLMDCVEQKLIHMTNMDNIELTYKFATIYGLDKFIKSFHSMMENKLSVILAKPDIFIKSLNTITNNHLLDVIIKSKNKEIQELNDKITAITAEFKKSKELNDKLIAKNRALLGNEY